ncbi:MAG: phosphatase PAP2 family protein [Desulfomonilaceae bacterium]
MNLFDHAIMSYINKFSQHSFSFDYAILVLSGDNLLKGGVLAIIFWWAWFKNGQLHPNNREHIISTILSALIAMPFARVLALTLPFRLRPGDAGLDFLLPYGMKLIELKGWSSFPSDHAVLFFTLSTGRLFISKKIGAFALAYTVLFICFPRIYLGLHFPTDIIAGAIIGISFGYLGNLNIVGERISQPILSWECSRPSLFYSLLFLTTYQIADTFQSSMDIIRVICKCWHIS